MGWKKEIYAGTVCNQAVFALRYRYCRIGGAASPESEAVNRMVLRFFSRGLFLTDFLRFDSFKLEFVPLHLGEMRNGKIIKRRISQKD